MKTATNPTDYAALHMWDRSMMSAPSWTEMMQQKAFDEGAPIDAIYYGYDYNVIPALKKWRTVRDLAPDHHFRLKYEEKYGPVDENSLVNDNTKAPLGRPEFSAAPLRVEQPMGDSNDALSRGEEIHKVAAAKPANLTQAEADALAKKILAEHEQQAIAMVRGAAVLAPLRLYYNTGFEGHYPVGTCALVSAYNNQQAAILLQVELEKHNLKQEVNAEDMQEFPMNSPMALVVVNGDYY